MSYIHSKIPTKLPSLLGKREIIKSGVSPIPPLHYLYTQICLEYFLAAPWALGQPFLLYIVDCIPATSHWLELWIMQPKSPRSQHLKESQSVALVLCLRCFCFCSLFTLSFATAALLSWAELGVAGDERQPAEAGERERASSICEWLLCAWSAAALQLSVCLMLPRGHL